MAAMFHPAMIHNLQWQTPRQTHAELDAQSERLLQSFAKLMITTLFGVTGFLAGVWHLAKTTVAKVRMVATDTTILVHLGEAKTYSEANDFCFVEYGTHLAVIENSDANQRLWDLLDLYEFPAWIGFSDLKNSDDFQWVDASTDLYQNWDVGEPTDPCVQMLAATGTWKDVHCSEVLTTFFCEATADSSAMAVVRLDNAEVFQLTAAVSSTEAQAYCHSQGGELYSVHNSADNAQIQTALNAMAVDFAFIGLQTSAAGYQWVDGTSLSFDKWSTGHPLENQFSQMRASDGRWMTACADNLAMAIVCTVADSHVVLKLDGVRTLERNTNVGSVSILDSYQISFKLKVKSVKSGLSELFSVKTSAPTNGNYYGGNPMVLLYSNTSTLHAIWNTKASDNVNMCEGQTEYNAVIGQWVDVRFVQDAGVVQLYADGVLQCQREGDWVGHNGDATLWLRSDFDVGTANAVVQDFTIKTWKNRFFF